MMKSDFSTQRLNGRARLRLVAGCSTLAPILDKPSSPLLVLDSALQHEKAPIRISVLSRFFGSLLPNERIDFVHRVDRRSPRPTYRLSIGLACGDGRRAALERSLRDAVAAAFPGYLFGSIRTDEIELSALTHVWQFAPAGITLANPVFSRFGTEGYQNDAGSPPEIPAWPFPGELANWPLSTPLSQEPYEPADIEIAVRIHGFEMCDATCRDVHQVLMRVQAGNLRAYHPEAPVSEYSASEELKAAGIDLLKRWLCAPTSGYAIDCVIQSSLALGDVALSRYVRDVFGKRPVSWIKAFERSAPEALLEPSFAWACLPDQQGIPALMPEAVGLAALGVRQHFASPLFLPPQSGAKIGETACGLRNDVRLPGECRSRHVAIFGATGSGKSTLLLQMFAEGLRDPSRDGSAIICPHDDLVPRAVELVPAERVKDVILVDVRDPEKTACINPLEGLATNPITAEVVIGEILSLIESLVETRDSTGPMLRSNLKNLLLLCGAVPKRNGSFLDALRILEDSDFRDYLLAKCQNRNVVDYWERFRRTNGEHGYDSWMPYLLARLTPFTSNPVMKRLLCRSDSTVDLASAMDQGKILLFNISKSVLQDTECQILGTLLMTKFFAAALGRARLPVDRRRKFSVYCDEFQNFATSSAPRLFSEARKFGLCLTTANQSVTQLGNSNGKIASSVVSNTATKFVFRICPSDFETLKPYVRPQFDESTMANLPDFHAVACMSDQNRPLPPFMMRVGLPQAGYDTASIDQIHEFSASYTTSIKEANDELVRYYDLSPESLGAIPEQNGDSKALPSLRQVSGS
ncbi:type IV secretory system conjugative DNA transfer family protein [Propionivibrio dicarboxylicus]|uniref:AAA-like domain-containing protein n=1 Tax=Propionivibrio dicarboxylicus TaxID=83767 RepID=A0A1G8NK51_9RHOO|nr:TraM recognition domain-containing protein [Propionivibrio dicarboxylicus]SDI80522.1 AAA-like domain-containing protein [Propionivibrio dicarboxylicus]